MTSVSSCTQYDGPAVHSQMPASAPDSSGADQIVSPRVVIGVSADEASSSGPQFHGERQGDRVGRQPTVPAGIEPVQPQVGQVHHVGDPGERDVGDGPGHRRAPHHPAPPADATNTVS